MARVFITGSADGLGRAAATSLIDEGHEVVLHVRSPNRRSAVVDLEPRAAGVVVGDLSDAAETRSIAEQVNAIGRMDAVIHNAGVYREPSRGSTHEGHAALTAINILAPYILTALIERPSRLVYLSSSEHHAGPGALRDIDWVTRPWGPGAAYGESKFFMVALAFALARRWPDVSSNAVDPGWARSRMGGPGAPVSLATGARTQSWLAVSDDAAAKVSGHFWHQQRQRTPPHQAEDIAYQEQLLEGLRALTGVTLPCIN